LRRDSVVAAQLGWARLGVEFALRPELRAEFALAQGWAGNTWPRLQPISGGVVQLIFDSFAGPIRAGYQIASDRRGQGVLQVGYEF
jgi:hypothetical protein